jgi:hypothetical protein
MTEIPDFFEARIRGIPEKSPDLHQEFDFS